MQILTKVQIWHYQRRLTCFRASKPCAIDRGTRPANAQGNVLQSAEQQPSSSLGGKGGVCLLEYCTWKTQLQMKNAALSPPVDSAYERREGRLLQRWGSRFLVCTPLSSSRTSPSYLARWTASFCSASSSAHCSSVTAHACSTLSHDSCEALKTTCHRTIHYTTKMSYNGGNKDFVSWHFWCLFACLL